MSKKKKVSSLLSSEATGGDTADRGFRYQANLIVARIPNWLADDGFMEMIREALGDVEAKFFHPSLEITREYIEYKNHSLPPHEFWSEISHFINLDKDAPGVYKGFVLASKGISSTLNPILNGLRRVRDAYPFYKGIQEVNGESFNDFVDRVRKAGKNKDVAEFIFSKVRFELDLIDAEDHPRELFREALLRTFPVFNEIKTKKINEAYSRLVELVDSRRNQPITRIEFEKRLWEGIESKYIPHKYIRIHTTNYQTLDKLSDGSLIFEWDTFFGGCERQYPPSLAWNNELLFQLEKTKKWILSTNRSRLIRLSGSRRLSASFAIGAVFSSVSGFAISVNSKDGLWVTNNYQTPQTPEFKWNTDLIEGDASNEVVVGIGIHNSVNQEVESFLKDIGFTGPRLYLFGENAIVSDDHANHAVDKAKKIILNIIRSKKVKKAHLFLATPSQFALFLGHRLNATCVIQCYERKNPNVYHATCHIQLA